MIELYANLGLMTAISRLGIERGSSPEAAYLQGQLRQIEGAMPAFNLDPSIAHLAAEIAAFDETLTVDRRVALIMLIAASMVALSEGSTRLPVTGPQAVEPMARILGPLCAETAAGEAPERTAEMAQSIARMLESGAASAVIARSPDDYRPLLYLPPFIYHQRIRAAEVSLADRLRPLIAAEGALKSAREIVAAVTDVCDRPHWIDGREIKLSGEQRAAVRDAATRRLAIISGGPGTGKTSIVLAIVRLLARLGVAPAEIALAAPTGKAAHRMGESLRDGLAQVRDPAPADQQVIAAHIEPATIHRVLGFSPARGVFLHHRNNPLPASVVIVDECSMLDLNLMQRLAAALKPLTRLVLLGDADQLPSVAAGAVFRDLVAAVSDRNDNAESRICTRLTQSYRMNQADESGRAIFDFTQRINQGVFSAAGQAAPLVERAAPGALRFEGVELFDTAQSSTEEFLDRWFDEQIRDGAIDALADKVYTYGENGFDDKSNADLQRVQGHAAAARILCATRVLATGAERINAAMHRRAMAAAIRPSDLVGFLPGEPVMIVRNDYDRNLFNGDQGVIARVKRPDGSESPMAVFMRGNQCQTFHPSSIGDGLELCYATTVHKAQGSEFDAVAVVMPERSLPLVTRELLYTAVSRARKSVVLVGRIEMVRAAIAHQGTRYCGLAELLSGPVTEARGQFQTTAR
jgi:exodeoxyribonuclease V alpha subunit